MQTAARVFITLLSVFDGMQPVNKSHTGMKMRNNKDEI